MTVTVQRLLMLHVGHTVEPSEGVWLIPHMYAEGVMC